MLRDDQILRGLHDGHDRHQRGFTRDHSDAARTGRVVSSPINRPTNQLSNSPAHRRQAPSARSTTSAVRLASSRARSTSRRASSAEARAARAVAERGDVDPHVVARADAACLGQQRRDAGVGRRVGVARAPPRRARARPPRRRRAPSRGARRPRRAVPRRSSPASRASSSAVSLGELVRRGDRRVRLGVARRRARRACCRAPRRAPRARASRRPRRRTSSCRP